MGEPERCLLNVLAGDRSSSSFTEMMTLDWISALARYNRWMNDRLYELAASLSDDIRKRDCGAFFRSIHGTLNHLLLTDRVWLARFKGVTIPDNFMGPGGILSLDQELYSDFTVLRQERILTDEELSTWVAQVTHDQLAEPLVYMRRGQRTVSPLWWSLIHLFNHQTHHRGQITTLLNQLGSDPGVTDLVAMLRSEAQPESEASPSS